MTLKDVRESREKVNEVKEDFTQLCSDLKLTHGEVLLVLSELLYCEISKNHFEKFDGNN